MNKPIIAITARVTQQRYSVNQDYVDALKNAGAVCLLVLPQSKEELSTLLSSVSGICIPGGMDVDPKLYHQSNLGSDPIESEIDQLDLDVIAIAKEKGIPLFGICRGLQIINVAMGGTLIQDLTSVDIDHTLSSKNKIRNRGHNVSINRENFLYELFGHSIEVNTYHHQAIDRLADGLTVSAVSTDGVIEAIESKNLFAVQWHPERMVQNDLFEYFVNMCRKNG
ncbi:MAG: gamma-glutamyl-gamma-aminobutyrate hydrolase family protein [Erysipelotrichaceae bacterium]|nr:gamma-glutamyl-gamma-aminobutyrate hydrolase family protein [Erysipelotrichaceae bacterium]